MLKVSHAVLIGLSGFIWFCAGCFLLPLGIHLIIQTAQEIQLQNEFTSYVVHPLSHQLGGVKAAALVLISLCLFVGYFKGRYVLGKSAKRCAERILTFPNPIGLHQIYGIKYYIIVVVMMSLGMFVRYFGIAKDIRGVIDVIIGFALINGALITFRYAYQAKKQNINVKA